MTCRIDQRGFDAVRKKSEKPNGQRARPGGLCLGFEVRRDQFHRTRQPRVETFLETEEAVAIEPDGDRRRFQGLKQGDRQPSSRRPIAGAAPPCFCRIQRDLSRLRKPGCTRTAGSSIRPLLPPCAALQSWPCSGPGRGGHDPSLAPALSREDTCSGQSCKVVPLTQTNQARTEALSDVAGLSQRSRRTLPAGILIT